MQQPELCTVFQVWRRLLHPSRVSLYHSLQQSVQSLVNSRPEEILDNFFFPLDKFMQMLSTVSLPTNRVETIERPFAHSPTTSFILKSNVSPQVSELLYSIVMRTSSEELIQRTHNISLKGPLQNGTMFPSHPTCFAITSDSRLLQILNDKVQNGNFNQQIRTWKLRELRGIFSSQRVSLI